MLTRDEKLTENGCCPDACLPTGDLLKLNFMSIRNVLLPCSYVAPILWLVDWCFNGAFSTNGRCPAIGAWNILCSAEGQNKYTVKQWTNTLNLKSHKHSSLSGTRYHCTSPLPHRWLHLYSILNCTCFVFSCLDFPHYEFLVVLAVYVATYATIRILIDWLIDRSIDWLIDLGFVETIPLSRLGLLREVFLVNHLEAM